MAKKYSPRNPRQACRDCPGGYHTPDDVLVWGRPGWHARTHAAARGVRAAATLLGLPPHIDGGFIVKLPYCELLPGDLAAEILDIWNRWPEDMPTMDGNDGAPVTDMHRRTMALAAEREIQRLPYSLQTAT